MSDPDILILAAVGTGAPMAKRALEAITGKKIPKVNPEAGKMMELDAKTWVVVTERDPVDAYIWHLKQECGTEVDLSDDQTLWSHAGNYCFQLTAISRFRSRFKGKLLRLRYEDFHDEDEVLIGDLEEWLGVDLSGFCAPLYQHSLFGLPGYSELLLTEEQHVELSDYFKGAI